MHHDLGNSSQIIPLQYSMYLNPIPDMPVSVRIAAQFDQSVSLTDHVADWPFKVEQGILRTILAYRQCGSHEYGPLPAIVFETPDGMVYAINDCALFLAEECSWGKFEDVASPSNVSPQIRVLPFLEICRDHPEFEPFRKHVPVIQITPLS